MDSGCSKHITGSTTNFLSLKAPQGGSVSFGNGKKGYIMGVGRIGKSLSHSIENVYYVNGLKYNLLSVSQICDKGNKVEFMSKVYTVTNIVTGEVVLVAKRYKNIYVVDFESLQNGDLNCLSVIDNDAELCHRRLGHASFTLMNKLVKTDLVRGLPKSNFKNQKVCYACVKGKQAISSFKPKREVKTSKSLDLLHMDLCGPMRVASRGGKKYIFVIVDDYSRYTSTLFLKTKDETFEMFVYLVKKIQVKMGYNVVCIRSNHGTEFDNAKFDELCTENGITHNISAPRTPQQNGVVERKNKTLEDIARTMSLLNKTPYELLNKRKPKLTHLRTFGCKCFILNNGKEALGKFNAKVMKEYFWYTHPTSKLKKYTTMLKRDRRVDQDGEPLSVPGEVIDMENGKADMMSHVKESRKDDTNTSPSIREEPGPTITTTEAENRVVDAVQGTPLAEVRSSQEPQSYILESSTNEIQVPNWKHKSSHPFDNIITPLDSSVQTRSRARNSLAFSAFLSQIEPKNIKEMLKDADWITAMQEELHQFERNKKGTLISQQKYIKELLKRFHMEASKVIDTPIATATRLDMDELGSPVNQTMYRGIIGSLLYLTASTPDIVFTMGLCDSFDLIGYADADYAGYLVDRKSMSGMAHFLGSCLISWGTRKQNSVALSTAETEYVAVASCCAQSLWIKQQLENFGVFSDCVDMHDDYRANRQLMQFALVKRAKLTDARFVREPGSSDTA
ncbi:uncharacterized protein LOC142166857 [Nicotiana tabacum]|uniref:Uncharacterized protein LOC142166857 n=1 Tax=Nicotiana tabacum TaxID=4097 RepID=A0AC58SC05_TOBAC